MSTAALLADRAYPDVVADLVDTARRRIWVTMFLCDPRPPRDVEGLVLDLLTALATRRATGVDVRVLLGEQVVTADIAVANRATALLLGAYRVPVRFLVRPADDVRRGWHGKTVVVDDLAVVGSQNWTQDAFRHNVEDAVVLGGAPVATLSTLFQRQWMRGWEQR